MSFSGLTAWLDSFAEKLSATQKRELLRIIAQGLRVRMRDRINRQKDPSGRRFKPRKRDQVGSIKRGALFQKIGGHIVTRYSDSRAEVGFNGSTGRIAKIHQYGLLDRPNKKSRRSVRYSKRELVGFSDEDVQFIKDTVVQFLGSQS